MKTLLLALSAFGAMTAQLSAQQGAILFRNDSATRVTNSLTGTWAASGNTFRVALYAAQDGVTDESVLTLLATTNFFAPGLFSGGYVIIPFVAPGDYATLQVRIWESSYGNSYEAALAAPPANGRKALTGKSTLLRGRTTGLAPGDDLPRSGLQPIVLTAQAVPSFSVYNIIVSEGTNGTKDAVFTVSLLPPATNAATVQFATSDGTALAGSDYVSTNGTLSFSAGQTTNTVTVTLTPDGAAEPDEDFFFQLSAPTGAELSQSLAQCVITEVRITGISVDVAVTFNSVVNHHYVVEKSDDSLDWTPVAGAESVTGSGNLTTVFDRGGGCQPSRIYRARLLD